MLAAAEGVLGFLVREAVELLGLGSPMVPKGQAAEAVLAVQLADNPVALRKTQGLVAITAARRRA